MRARLPTLSTGRMLSAVVWLAIAAAAVAQFPPPPGDSFSSRPWETAGNTATDAIPLLAENTAERADDSTRADRLAPQPPEVNVSQLQPIYAAAIAPPGGDEMIRQAAGALGQVPSIAAQIRHRIRQSGHTLVGTGTYQQIGTGDNRLIRLEMNIPLDRRVTSLQVVGDGRFLWTRRDLDGTPRLGRIDLRRVRDSLEQFARQDGAAIDSAKPLAGLAHPTDRAPLLHGLPRLVDQLARGFAFGDPQPGRLNELSVWVVTGAWRPEALTMLLPDRAEELRTGRLAPADAAAALPAHVPDRVILTVGQDDLFPYRVEYRRTRSKDGAAVSSGNALAQAIVLEPPSDELMSIDLYEVRLGGEIDPLSFVYAAGDQEIIDDTPAYLDRMGLKPAGPIRPSPSPLDELGPGTGDFRVR